MQNIPNYFTTPNKMTSENDIKGLVSLKNALPYKLLKHGVYFSAWALFPALPPLMERMERTTFVQMTRRREGTIIHSEETRKTQTTGKRTRRGVLMRMTRKTTTM